jgi:bacteriocin-like protein
VNPADRPTTQLDAVGIHSCDGTTQEVDMPKSTKANPKKTPPKKGAVQKIKQGKSELSDEELSKVSGGQSEKKSINFA